MDKQTIHRDLVLGIDTGGTFTDGIILDSKTGELLAKTKSSTTKWDLSIGIGNCIDQLSQQYADMDIALVCLSTTLATNSVVEGKVSRVGLIAMDASYRPAKYEVTKQYNISGRMDLDGTVKEPIDEEEIAAALKDMKGGIDSLVISGYYSVRNPEHELRIKEMAAEMLNIPIICAHELSMSLGYHERTLTAVLNAHLLPVIDDLIRKTKETLQKNHIDAEIAIIKGDGSMMDEKMALERPVETVLSGPAASVIGGAFLTDVKDALFVDLGGTTTDIAYMRQGKVAVDEDGAVIGGWKTKVRAVNMYTHGLGGDSRLKLHNEKYSFGPMKAIPICFVAQQYPYLKEEFEEAKWSPTKLLRGFHYAEGLMLRDQHVEKEHLAGVAGKLVDMLSDGPHSIVYLSSKLELREKIFSIDHLINTGILDVISITPTDILHATGEYQEWDAEASKAAIATLAHKESQEPETIQADLKRMFQNQLIFAIMKSALGFDGLYDAQILDSPWFQKAMFRPEEGTKLMCNLGKDIVALGAPARAWIAPLADQLGAKVIVPENHEVTNAIGAAKGQLTKRMEILIVRDFYLNRCRIHTPWGLYDSKTMMEAKKIAMGLFEEHIAKFEEESGVFNYTRNLEEKKLYLQPNSESQLYEIRLAMEVSAAPEFMGE